jgi:hypothetical protein
MIDWLVPGVVFAGLIALLWRQTLTLGRLAGINTRERDRERHDSQQMIERLLEKRDAGDGLEMARMHKIERLETNRLDAGLEKAADQPAAAPPQPEDEFCTPDQYED